MGVNDHDYGYRISTEGSTDQQTKNQSKLKHLINFFSLLFKQ